MTAIFIMHDLMKDWTGCQNGSFSLLNDDADHCEFFQVAHKDVEEMMTSSPDIFKDTRVIILKVWSNGYEAHNVNGLQVFTVKLSGPKSKTFPYTVCFKTTNVQKILF